MYRYGAFGLTLESEAELPFMESPPGDAADVTLRCAAEPFAGPRTPIQVHRDKPEAAPGGARIERCAGGVLLRYEGEVELRITPGSVVCHPCPGSDRGVPGWAAPLYLVGPALSVCLEMRGEPVLHSSAVAVGERAVLFIASSGGGKSTLATHFVASGLRLVSDDMVPVSGDDGRLVARPGYPQMRLWLEDALRVVGDAARRLPLVHPDYDKRRVAVGPRGFGEFESRSLPIGAVYMLDRRPAQDRCRFEALPAGERLVELIRQSFAAEVVDALGLQSPSRLGVLAALATTVPVRRLSYPSGRDNLPEVAAAVLEDLAHVAKN